MKKKLLSLITISTMIFSLAACSSNNSNQTEDEPPVITQSGVNATITMEDGEEILLELYPDKAQNTVTNFVSLANKGFYDGLIFHRVIPGFMIQGGDPEGTGTGGPGYSIAGEFSSNGFSTNDLVHSRGVISMARSGDPDSAGSQFFIMHEDSQHLDGEYAAFGKVLSGMETVNKIASTETDAGDKPLTEQKIKTITTNVETNVTPNIIK